MTTQQILNSLNNNYSFTIILVCNKNSNPDEFVLKLISKLENKDTLYINGDPDIIAYDGLVNSIKKDDILELQNNLNYSSISNKKFRYYYLKNFEYSSRDTFNTLLKFIEEPNPNNIGIITVNDVINIPSTILSRCSVYHLDEDKKKLDEILVKYNLIEDHWVINIFHDLSYLESFITSDSFSNLDKIHNFFMNVNINDYKSNLDLFKTLNYTNIKILLKSLIIKTRDNLQQLLDLINDLKNNPIKQILFVKIFNIMENKNV